MTALLLVGINVIVQVILKPMEILRLLSWSKPKGYQQTWNAYGGSFQSFATPEIPAELLAAITQAESGGDPLSGPAWSFQVTDKLSKIYSPASSSFGLLQMTEGTFDEAKNLCYVDGRVLPRTQIANYNFCWIHDFYLRAWPSHSIKLAALKLNYDLAEIQNEIKPKKLNQTQNSQAAAISHLCGVKRAIQVARRGFRFNQEPACGSHSIPHYISRILSYERQFKQISKLKLQLAAK